MPVVHQVSGIGNVAIGTAPRCVHHHAKNYQMNICFEKNQYSINYMLYNYMPPPPSFHSWKIYFLVLECPATMTKRKQPKHQIALFWKPRLLLWFERNYKGDHSKYMVSSV